MVGYHRCNKYCNALVHKALMRCVHICEERARSLEIFDTISNYFYLWQVTHLQMLNLLNDLSVPSCHGKQKYVHCITYFVLWMRFFYTNNKLWSSEEMSPNLRLVSDKYFTMALSSQHSARFNCLSGVLLSFVVPILSCGIFLFWKI